MASDVKYVVSVDSKGAVSGIKEVDKSIDGMKEQAKQAKSPLMGMFKQFAIGLGSVIAVRAAFKKLTQFMGDCIGAAVEQERVTAQLEAVLKSTKDAAGLTKDELLKMASGLQEVTAYGDEAIIGAENLLLTFTNIGEKVFPAALATVLDMSTALGTDLKSSALQLGKALNDPIEGVTALKRVGVSFTDAQREQIKVLVESGNALDAQNLILKELQVEFGGAARAAADTFGGALQQLKNYWGDLKEEVGKAIIENEAIKGAIGDLKEEIVILIETGEIANWANTASKAVSGLVWAVREAVDVITEFKPVPIQMAEGLSEWTMNMIGMKSPQQEMNELQKEATLRAIEFKDSLKVLSPEMEEIREHFEKGKTHADAWMLSVKDADEKAHAFQETIKGLKEWWGKTNELWAASHPIITTITELLETKTKAVDGVAVSLGDYETALIKVWTVLRNAQPDLVLFYETAIPKARELNDVVEKAPGKFQDMAFEVKATGEEISKFYKESIEGIVGAFGAGFESISTKGSDLSDAIDITMNTLVNNVRRALRDLLEDFLKENIFDAITGKAKETVSAVTSLVSGGGGAAGGVAGVAGGLSGAATGLWTAAGAAVGTFLGNLVTGGGGPDSTDKWHWRMTYERCHEIRDLLGTDYKEEVHILQNHAEASRMHLFEIQARMDEANRHLKAIKENLKGIPSGQGGLDFYSGSRGGLVKYHPGERVTINPNIQNHLSVQPMPLSIKIGEREIMNVMVKLSPSYSKHGQLKFHQRASKKRY